MFGEGLLISRVNGRALISVVGGVNSVVQDVVTSVFNNSHFLDLHFTQHDQDFFYFVKVFHILSYNPLLQIFNQCSINVLEYKLLIASFFM